MKKENLGSLLAGIAIGVIGTKVICVANKKFDICNKVKNKIDEKLAPSEEEFEDDDYIGTDFEGGKQWAVMNIEDMNDKVEPMEAPSSEGNEEEIPSFLKDKKSEKE